MDSQTFPPLSISLRNNTREAHRLAESSPFMRELFAARLPLPAYRFFLCQLYQIYSALEECSAILQTDHSLQDFYLPALFRRPALEADLRFYYGDESWREVEPLESTRAYVQRIQTISQDWLPGLIAHHYTRYLGDLSGGQAMKRIVAKMYHLDSEQGLAFFDFPKIADITAFKNEYRARLDALPLDEQSAQKLIAEANHAFELNRQVFNAMMEVVPVDRHHPILDSPPDDNR
ncbi:MAG: Heme oxygenase [Anaerolineae bacterium]|jgi:heme oxygenase|nr:MAG: Heme oxygenase [Anaerolineae bacterium]